MRDKGQMIFSNFMSILYVTTIFVAIFFITYSVLRLKNFVSGPLNFKSEIDFKNSFSNRFDFAKELEMLNIVFSGVSNDDNITTFETLQMINIINSTSGKQSTFYDGLFPPLESFPITRRFFFVYNDGDWKVIEAEKEFLGYDYQNSNSIPPSFPMSAVSFFANYLNDVYSFKSFEFPIFFRRYIGFIVVSDYIIEGSNEIVNV